MQRVFACMVFIAALAAMPSPTAAAAPPQSPSPPPRDGAARTATTGTAAIHGRVVDAETSRPLRRARINLTGPGLPPQGMPTSTDEDGRYEFLQLPAGRFNLSVQRGGYLQLRYGQRRPGEQGTPLDVQAGQTLERIDFALPRAAVIAGRITDELGEPIAGVWVSAQRYIYSQERRRLMPDGPLAITDDQGDYRIVGLMPGTYVVNARTFEKWTTQTGGREEMMSYAPTFYPGITDGGQASSITVATGQQVQNIDFQLVAARAARISGTMVDSRGQAVRTVSLSFEIMGSGGGVTGAAGQASVGEDGRFTLADVPPGEYRLQGVGTQESVSTQIVVTGSDIADLSLATSAGWSLRGDVVIESEMPAALKRTDVTIAPVPVLGRQFATGGPTQRQVINDDWTFLVSGVVGPSRLRVTLPDGWALKSVLQGNRDLADARLDLASGEDVTGVQVVVTDRVATLTGQLTAGKAGAGDGTVLLFPADSAKWFEGSRFVRAARPDQQGRYRITGILPGRYFVVALDYVEQNSWNDPEYLESLRRHAQAVTFERPDEIDLPLRVVMTP